ncbi:MAG TPA: hypothetical protein VF892_08670, partial [Pseudonocardiaceae bacterium]
EEQGEQQRPDAVWLHGFHLLVDNSGCATPALMGQSSELNAEEDTDHNAAEDTENAHSNHG